MNTLQFTKADKRAIRKNQQKMVNILGANSLADAYEELANAGDYDKLIGIAPIFKKINDILEIEDVDDEADDDELDRINEIDQKIIDFLVKLPVMSINLDFDAFYEKYHNVDNFFCDFTENYSFSDLFNVLLDTEKLTKDEKTKIISIITEELI